MGQKNTTHTRPYQYGGHQQSQHDSWQYRRSQNQVCQTHHYSPSVTQQLRENASLQQQNQKIQPSNNQGIQKEDEQRKQTEIGSEAKPHTNQQEPHLQNKNQNQHHEENHRQNDNQRQEQPSNMQDNQRRRPNTRSYNEPPPRYTELNQTGASANKKPDEKSKAPVVQKQDQQRKQQQQTGRQTNNQQNVQNKNQRERQGNRRPPPNDNQRREQPLNGRQHFQQQRNSNFGNMQMQSQNYRPWQPNNPPYGQQYPPSYSEIDQTSTSTRPEDQNVIVVNVQIPHPNEEMQSSNHQPLIYYAQGPPPYQFREAYPHAPGFGQNQFQFQQPGYYPPPENSGFSQNQYPNQNYNGRWGNQRGRFNNGGRGRGRGRGRVYNKRNKSESRQNKNANNEKKVAEEESSESE